MTAPRALMSTEQAARLLDHVIFGRIAELVDLPALYDLEAMLAHQIGGLCADLEHGRALARALVDRALLRLADTPRRWHTADPARPHDPGPGPDVAAACTGAPRPTAMEGPSAARRARHTGSPRPPPIRRATPRRAV